MDSTATHQGRSPLRRVLALLFTAALLLFVLGDSCVSHGRGVWERDGSGDLVQVDGPGDWGETALIVNYARSESNASSSIGTVNPDVETEQPMRLSSVTLLDVSDTPLSRRIGRDLLKELEDLPIVQRVDLRAAGDGVVRPLGDQILAFEVIEESSGHLGFTGRATVDAAVSHMPEFGWAEVPGVLQRCNADAGCTTELLIVGSPLARRAELADAAAEQIDLTRILSTFQETEAPVPAYPDELVDPQPDLGDSAEGVEAMGIDGAPAYCGMRHARKGEALWRYEGPDATDRIDEAMERLLELGWERDPGVGTRGADGATHMAVMRKGDQFLRWQYHENRETRLQTEWWTTGSDGVQTHHVEGPALDPVVWLHYRNERSEEELRALHVRAKEAGVEEPFLASLARSQAELLAGGEER